MADDIKKVEVAITSTYDGKGAQQAAVDQEKLTNTGKGLATTIPELSAKTEAYIITSEKEYLAIQKSAEVLRTSIGVRQAAGLAFAEQAEHLKALEAALATERAQSIAAEIENNRLTAASVADAEAAVAEAAARSKAAEAKMADAAATEASTAATDAQLLIGRKAINLMDEIARGNRGAMVSTIGNLFSKLNMAELIPVAGTIAAIGYGIDKWIESTIKEREEFQGVNKEADKAQETLNKILDAGGNIHEQYAKLQTDMGGLAAKTDEEAQFLRRWSDQAAAFADQLEEASANLRATETEQNSLSDARLKLLSQLGLITTEETEQLRIQLELKQKLFDLDSRSRQVGQEVQKTQEDLTQKRKEQASLPSPEQAEQNYQHAHSTAERDRALITQGPKVLAQIDASVASAVAQANAAMRRGDVGQEMEDRRFIDTQERMRVAISVAMAEARQNLAGDTQTESDAKSVMETTQKLPEEIQILSEKLQALTKQLEQTQKDAAGQKQTATQAAATQATAELFKSGETPESIVAGVAAGNKQEFEHLNTILTAMGDDSQTRIRILEAIAQHLLSQKAETDRIKQWLNQIGNQASQANESFGSVG